MLTGGSDSTKILVLWFIRGTEGVELFQKSGGGGLTSKTTSIFFV